MYVLEIDGNNPQRIDGVKECKNWIANRLNEVSIKYAEKFGIELTAPTTRKNDGSTYKDKNHALTTSQIRNVFGEVKRLQMKGFNYDEFLLLKPRFAYAAQRKGTQGSEDFHKVMGAAMDAVIETNDSNEQQKRFINFCNLFESILAYHRAHGGR